MTIQILGESKELATQQVGFLDLPKPPSWIWIAGIGAAALLLYLLLKRD